MKVVIIGGGANIIASHLPGLQAIHATVVGVQDVNLERARKFAESVHAPLFRNLDQLLAQEADLAVIVAPHPFHAELTLACLDAGLHVLTEKPLTDEVALGDVMIERARERKRLLAVSFQRRARQEIQAARRLIQSGALGEIQRADVLGTWTRRRAYFEVAPWRGSWRGEGGGVLINQGQHDLDLLCYLAGRPSRVVGWTRTRIHPIETEDTAVALLEWPSRAVGSVHITTSEIDESQRIEITGTSGRLRVVPGRLEAVRNHVDMRDFAVSAGAPFEGPEVGEPETTLGAPGSHVDVYRNLERAIAGEEPLLASAEDALIPLEVANAIEYSSASGSAVTLPLDRRAYGEFLSQRRAAAATRS
jgi:predicted dehydrogenase